ncbi:putative oxalate formate antiporter [Diaporthe ampelina]|uniref:Putative oxalate formate antiporter n=1 Tax=Diaporthe ampelina TaxID=1214573 RepID=A0A0G2F6G6_9PEZI|nr:putative oxalate formate antiporter [Diaporthe ampelina]
MRVSRPSDPVSPVQEMQTFDDEEIYSETYPEGGRDAWLVVAGAWCAMIPSMGVLNTLAVLQAWVSEHELEGFSESTIGWVFSTYAFFLYFCGAQVGPIFDAHDIRLLVVPGCVGIVAATMLMSVCKGGVGGVVFPLIIVFMAPRVGFPWAIRTVGLICAAASVGACLLLRKRLPPNRKAGAAIDLKALADPKFGVTALAVFLIEFAVFIPYTYICSYAIHEGVDLQTSLLLNALVNAGAIPGRALPGYVADRFGPMNVMCITALVCATFIFALWLTAVGGQGATIAFATLFGFWSGAGISLTPVCVGQACRTEDYGAIVQWCGGAYYGLIVFAGGLYFLSLCAFFIARGICGGWSLKILF